MNSHIIRNIIRAVFVLFIQLVLLKRINITIGDFNYIHLTVYPIIILLIPYNSPRPLTILIAFLIGLFVDIFYDSLGVHAGACTMVAFARYYILGFVSPTNGYKNPALTAYQYGVSWLLTYSGIFLFIHLFTLYSLEAFSFVYITEIALRTIFSFVASLFLMMVGYLIFNPKY